jgi:ABC-type multidrug transport system permease subunit
MTTSSGSLQAPAVIGGAMPTPRKKVNQKREATSIAVEIPKQLIIVLFFGLFFVFASQSWSEGRMFGSYELLVLICIRSAGGLLFWWLEIDD